MIFLQSPQPILAIANYQLVNYDMDWIKTALDRASQITFGSNFPLAQEMLTGLEHYLKHEYAYETLKIEDLFSKINQFLVQIGMDKISQNLELLSPPLSIDLLRHAQGCFELGFFETLRKEITHLRQRGVEDLFFYHLEEAVRSLNNARRWSPSCKKLSQEIQGFISQF